MTIATVVASRGTCDRKKVGAVIVRDKTILSTGYNGSIRGMPHCDDAGHMMENDHCVAGDTVISKFQSGYYNTGHRTIRQICENWQDPQKRGAMKRMKIRSVNEAGFIVPDHITDVWRSPPKQLLRITTRLGRSVRVTEEQLVLTLDGWVPAEQIKPGKNLVALNGQQLYNDPVWLRHQYRNLGHTQVEIAELLGCHRTTIKDRLNRFNIPLREFHLGGWNKGMQRDGMPGYKGRNIGSTQARRRSRRYGLQGTCAVCGGTCNLEVHHIDSVPQNDADSNLLTLCIGCHAVAHTPHAKREKVIFDPVKYVVRDEKEEVFDLTTLHNHNYVGDGVVLHNCVATIHAEANALVQAARHGVCVESSAIYVTASPCWNCFKLIANAGIKEIYYGEFYRDERIFSVAQTLGMRLVSVEITGV